MKPLLFIISLIVIFAVVVWYLLAYVLVSDEQRIRWIIEKGRLGIENGSLFTLSNLLAPDYQDSSGMDRAMVLGSLQQLFQETKNRRLIITKTIVSVHDLEAEAEVTFSFLSDYSGTVQIPKALKDAPQTIHVVFRKSGRQWLISQTSHDVRINF